MSANFSSVISTSLSRFGGNFSAYRLDRSQLLNYANPIIGFDHYHMQGPTFAPHPHAGFSAISYVFEDSPGALRNRDSLGNDFDIQPGGLLWMQAGSGVVHDEVNNDIAREVHGLQLFVNLSGKHKQLPPQIHRLAPDEIAETHGQNGNHIRVLSGKADELASFLSLSEPFDFIETRLKAPWRYRLKKGWNTVLYVVSGSVKVVSASSEARLASHQALGIHMARKNSLLEVTPVSETHLLVFSGADPQEPVAVYGPFVMNTQAQLEQAYQRYQQGLMGRLLPL